jgi:hypothetical protein
VPCVQITPRAKKGVKKNSGNPDDYILTSYCVVVSPAWWRRPWTQKESTISLDTRKYWAQNEAYFMRILPDPQLAQIDVSLTNMRNALRTRSVPLKVYGARLLEHYPSSTLPMRIGDCTTTQLSAQGLTPVPPLACSCTAERAGSDLRVAAGSPPTPRVPGACAASQAACVPVED